MRVTLYQRGCVVLLLLLAMFSAGAQVNTVTGIVVDSATFEPLPYVTVQVKNTMRGTSTDIRGNFSIQATELDTLILSILGYQRLELPLIGYEASVIRLAERVTMLETITIGDYRGKLYEGMFDDQNQARLKQSIPFYYSKARKDKIRAARWREETLHVQTYINVVVNNPETKDNLMKRFKLSEQEYYNILTRFNEAHYDIMYYLTEAELISFLNRFFENETRR